MKHIGIYGGSFNPIHRGHTQLATWLIRQGIVDELWLLVSPLNPLKEHPDELLPDAVRLRLAKLAIRDETCSGHIRVSDFEMHLPRPSYTATTLRELRRSYPMYQFSLIIGADNWLNFDHWYHPNEILAHHPLFVYPRPGFPLDAKQLPHGVCYLSQAPIYDISSSQLRQAIAHPQAMLDPSQHLSTSVWAEIKDKKLYV